MAGRAPGGPEAGKPSGGGGSFPYRRGSEGPSQVPKAMQAELQLQTPLTTPLKTQTLTSTTLIFRNVQS